MNKIVLIGNGFDLAHNLKTSYKDFINNYWAGIAERIANGEGTSNTDKMVVIELDDIRITCYRHVYISDFHQINSAQSFFQGTKTARSIYQD